MKLRNKKTGEIGYPYFQNWKEISCVIVDENAVQIAEYTSLAELQREWEDMPEEPKEYWYIYGNQVLKNDCDGVLEDRFKEIGNYFKTKEEAEKAVEKLKAWKLLKDMGFKIEGIRYRNNKSYIEWSISQKVREDHFTSEAFNECLHLLFGDEE